MDSKCKHMIEKSNYVYPVIEIYKHYCSWCKKKRHRPDSYESYVKMLQDSKVDLQQRSYIDQETLFRCIVTKSKIRWITGLCSNAGPVLSKRFLSYSGTEIHPVLLSE